MSTETGWGSPVVNVVSVAAYALTTIGVAAIGWFVTVFLWGIAIGPDSALAAATAIAVVPVLALGYVAVSMEGSPTLSMAAYVICLAGAAAAFLAAVWATVFLFVVIPLGFDTAATAAGLVTLALAAAVAAVSVAAVTAVGKSTDWTLVFRMAVAILLLVLITIGFLAAIWLVAFVLSTLLVGPVLGVYVAGGITVLATVVLGYHEYTQVESIEQRADATPTSAADLPGIHATTTKVATQLGVPMPTIAISETHAPEAMVVGFRPSDTHLILSYGAVTALTDAELEAVIAHELAHVANRDAMVMTAVSAPVVLADGLRARVRDDLLLHGGREWDEDEWKPPAETPDPDGEWGDDEIFGPDDEWRAMTLSPNSDDDDNANESDGWLLSLVLFIIATVAWLISRAITAVLSRARETAADRTAVEVTGSPAALAGALRALDDRITQMPTRDLREVASVSSLSILPLEPMATDPGDPDSVLGRARNRLHRLRVRLFRSHPPTEQRLAELEALERERR
ncbi:M48 family metalloprotease [Natrinema sp. SYSU A 869]|uniref:M48 family metalloprotease n=1 Tax=Natrinema sp. SYSU A 869 TaxID=2871694 RepID=UPI001CA3932E|nr:M48 family metalloprotease [Natrinema sp. SYSU A 869]